MRAIAASTSRSSAGPPPRLPPGPPPPAGRRTGPSPDGAPAGAAAASTASHLSACAGCRERAEALRRLRLLLQRALVPAAHAEPAWTGLWPGGVRGIEGGRAAQAPARGGARG